MTHNVRNEADNVIEITIIHKRTGEVYGFDVRLEHDSDSVFAYDAYPQTTFVSEDLRRSLQSLAYLLWQHQRNLRSTPDEKPDLNEQRELPF